MTIEDFVQGRTSNIGASKVVELASQNINSQPQTRILGEFYCVNICEVELFVSHGKKN